MSKNRCDKTKEELDQEEYPILNFCYNNTYIRNCNRKEEEYKYKKKEEARKSQKDNCYSVIVERESENFDKCKENFVTNPYIRIDVTKKNFLLNYSRKFGKEISDKGGRVEIYIGKPLKEAIKKISNFNLSAFVREKLIEFLQTQGIQIEEPEPDLLLLVYCPHCNRKFVTSSVKLVRCEWCGKPFRIWRKRAPTRIIKIVKGSRRLLWSKVYG